MATAHRASGTTTLQRSARAGRKRGGIPWQSPLTQMVEESILTGFWVAGITRTLEGHIWTRPRCQGTLEWKTHFGTDAAIYPYMDSSRPASRKLMTSDSEPRAYIRPLLGERPPGPDVLRSLSSQRPHGIDVPRI